MGVVTVFFSSPRVDKNNERSRFDVNIRSVIAFREIDKGLTSIETFCSHITYAEIVNTVHPIYVEAAEESMSTAAAATMLVLRRRWKQLVPLKHLYGPSRSESFDILLLSEMVIPRHIHLSFKLIHIRVLLSKK